MGNADAAAQVYTWAVSLLITTQLRMASARARLWIMCSRLTMSRLLLSIRPMSASYCRAELPHRSHNRIRLDLSAGRSGAAMAITAIPMDIAISFNPWVR